MHFTFVFKLEQTVSSLIKSAIIFIIFIYTSTTKRISNDNFIFLAYVEFFKNYQTFFLYVINLIIYQRHL
jgi:hypothetical protein